MNEHRSVPRRHSPRLSPWDAAIIKKKLMNGEMQHAIAAAFGVNQGRISEIKTGKRFAEVQPAQ